MVRPGSKCIILTHIFMSLKNDEYGRIVCDLLSEIFLVSTAFITLHTADRTVMSQQDAAEKQVKANIDVFLHLTVKPQRKEKVWSFTSFQSVKSRLSHYISQTFVLVRKQI